MVNKAELPGQSALIGFDVNAGRTIRRLFFILLGCEIFLVLGDAFINVERLTELGPIRRFFNITREDGLASWFAVTQTWMLGLTALCLYYLTAARHAERWRTAGWATIAVFLLYMAMDDGSKFHERIGSSAKTMILGDDADSGEPALGFFPSYTWQLVFLPVFGAFGLFLLWFLNRELGAMRDKLSVIAAVGLLILAVVADFFEGMELDHPANLHGWIKETWHLSSYQVRHYSKSVEEFMEMFSMTILWLVFLRHLVRIAPAVQVRFHNP